MAKTAKTVLELVTNIDEYLADLKKGEKGNDEFDKSVQKISKGFQTVGKDISAFGTGLSTYVTLPIVGAVAATGALVMSMVDSADAIAKNAREAGLSAEAYQELKFAVGQVGKLTEEQVDGAFRKLTQTIGDAAAGSDKAQVALQLLGFTQKDIESGAITTEDAFKRFNATMQGTTSQAEAVAIAGELVGDKIGPSLAAALRTSGSEVDTLRGQFKELGLGMSQDTLDASEEFKDELDVLERQIGAVGHEIAAEFLPILTDDLLPFIRTEVIPRIREFGQWLAGLAKGFADLSPTMQMFIGGGIALVAALGPILLIVGQLVTAFGVVLPAAIGATNVALGLLAANPIALAAMLIAGAFVAVGVAADNSTGAIRRQIQAANDYKTIGDLFNKTSALTADEQKRLKEALERTEKQTYINSKGLGDLSKFSTGLTLDSEELALGLDESLSPAMRRTKAEIERLRKEQEEAAKAAKKHAGELKTLSDNLTGKGLKKEMEDLAFVVGQWSDKELEAALRQGEVTKKVLAFREAGQTLPPILHNIWLGHEQLNPSIKVTTTNYQDLLKLGTQIGALKPPPPMRFITLPINETAGEWVDGLRVAGEDGGNAFIGAFGRAIEGLGDVVVGAIMGGGDVGKAMGAHIGLSLGNELGKHLTATLSKKLGENLGKLIGGFAGPLGALLGGAIGGLVDKIFGGNDTKKDREAAAKMLGFSSLKAMNDALFALGDEGARLADIGLNKIGKKDKDANAAWIAEVEALFAKQKQAADAAANAIDEAAERKKASVQKIRDAYDQQLNELQSHMESLSKSIEAEAEEAEMGMTERAEREELARLELKKQSLEAQRDAEIKAEEEALDESKRKILTTAEVVRGGIAEIFKDPIPLTFSWTGFPRLPGGGEQPEFGGNMAEGWYGRVFKPTMFIAGEKPGGEDVAFSGVGRSFRSNTERPIIVQIENVTKLDGRVLAASNVQHQAAAMRRAGG